MYASKKITKENKDKIDTIFYWLGGTPIDIFKNPKWNVIYIECRPFIDEDSYPSFLKFFDAIQEKEVSVFPYPTYLEENYVLFEENMPNYQGFDKVMEEYSFRIAGGVAFGSKMDWGIHSDADNHILFLGYAPTYSKEVEQSFSKNEFVLNKQKVMNIYNDM